MPDRAENKAENKAENSTMESASSTPNKAGVVKAKPGKG